MKNSAAISLNEPQISVLIPCYNAAAFIVRTLESLLAQKSAAAEILVVDEGSTDNSLAILRQFGDRIHVVTGPNHGASSARNRGLARARAPFVLFMDADDYHEGEVLGGLLDAVTELNADLAFAPCAQAGDRVVTRAMASPDTSSARSLLQSPLHGDFAPPSAMLWRRDFVTGLGGWREDLQRNEDGELQYRAVARAVRPCLSAQGRVIYWTHDSPTRVTRVHSDRSMLDGHKTLLELDDLVAQTFPDDQYLRRAISSASFDYEKLTARLGMTACSEKIHRLRAERRFAPSHDDVVAQGISRVLGLGRKERLYHFAMRVRNYLRRKLGL